MVWAVGWGSLSWTVGLGGETAGPVAEESLGPERHCCLAWGVGWAEGAGGDEASYAYESSEFLVSFLSMLDILVNMLTHKLLGSGLFWHRL